MGHVHLWRRSCYLGGLQNFLPPIPSKSSKIQTLTLFCLPLYSHFSTPSLVFILFQLPQFLLLLFCFVFGCSSNKMTLLLSRAFVFFICSTEMFGCIPSELNLLLKCLIRDHSRVKVLPSMNNTSLLSRFLFPSKHINTLSATCSLCVFPEEM